MNKRPSMLTRVDLKSEKPSKNKSRPDHVAVCKRVLNCPNKRLNGKNSSPDKAAVC